MANWNKMTESHYNAIKILLENGASIDEAAKYMKCHRNTVLRINKSESFEEYTQIVTEINAKRNQVAAIKAKQEEQKPQGQTVTIQANFLMMEEMRKTNELLKLISNKLAFIVDELCGTPQAK
jgi:hypothetical protein